MKISELKSLLKDRRVMEEIHKHLWIESQKAGYNIGIERATDEWLRLYAEGWMKYHMPEKFKSKKTAKKTTKTKSKSAKRKTKTAKPKKK